MSHVLVRVVDGVDSWVPASGSVLAVDGLAVIGTIGFFGPAAALVAIVTVAIIRDRRLVARENEEAEQRGEPLD